MKARANQQMDLFLVNCSPRQNIYTVGSWVNKFRSSLYCLNRNTDLKKEDQTNFHFSPDLLALKYLYILMAVLNCFETPKQISPPFICNEVLAK